MSYCYLNGYGSCSGRISSEHYISKSVLKAISISGNTQIGGLPWQTPKTLRNIGINALVSNILCEKHNSSLSSLDTIAGKFFRALDYADKQPQKLPLLTTIDGPLIERWLLKVMCGLVAGPGIKNHFHQIVPEEWKSILSGASWPDGCGLYVPVPSDPQLLTTEFFVKTLINPITNSIQVAQFRLAGVPFNLLFKLPDQRTAYGAYRPRGMVFQNNQTEKRIEFIWPFWTNQAIFYKKIGSSKDKPPQWSGWKE